jgi:hypothetical protein
MACNPPFGRLAACLAPLALAAGCDGTISGLHRTRGVAPEVYAPPVSSAAQARANEPRQIRAQHLLVMHRESRNGSPAVTRSRAEARARADEARAKVREGADFDEIVRQYSDEPGAAARNGDLGQFSRRMMVKAFSDAAFRLRVGEVSEVVESEFGFHVIRRTE